MKQFQWLRDHEGGFFLTFFSPGPYTVAPSWAPRLTRLVSNCMGTCKVYDERDPEP